MSLSQKIFMAILPKKWAENMAEESRRWMVHCPCGYERSVWEMGGIRWKAAGKDNQYVYCPHCGKSHWHSIYYKMQPTEEPKSLSV